MKGGDDFEDDFIADDLVALSDDEEELELSEGHDLSTQSEDPESSTPQVTSDDKTASAKKRKREKEREKFKERKRRKMLAAAITPERSITEQPPHKLAEYLATLQAKTFSKMSVIELEDMRIPASAISDTSIWTGPRTLDNFVDFIGKVLPNLRLRLSQRSKTNGAPTMVFVSGAALRVVDVTRVLKDKRLRGDKGGEVAKLFARHFKVSEHVAYLRRTKIGSAVGTPGRIGKLLENDALVLSAMSHIILDISFRDAKNRNMLDIPETRDEVFNTVLGAPKVLQAIKEGKIQVVLL
ncbi:U3-containing 90S pre-ribosomal complex subunit-domain containing protein [Mycena pura]|uniref:U3-containing 90S pre-ribosomal complex subunit-domain containing protein n=1 Tax=Mycena pura TaxID=153505 RepID=A0AAD6VT64_9AGAR|nr:U3-containing 90S pre-ribosomal complex subunit-domain containing protein [Mycena pura]